MTTTREFLSKNRILFDGAFGTYFAQITHGQTENCELANLNLPQTVARIHREYIEAGANAIKTNTFAAYPDLCGGAENQKKIIRAAVALAREEADKTDGEVRVFADLGPAPGESRQQKTDSYIQAASLFLDEGITDFVFETQAEEDGLLPAVREIRKREKESFIVVSFGVLPDGYSPKGIYYRTLILDMLSSGLVDAAGLNCVVNAGNMRRLLAALPSGLLARTCAMPNAGYPVVRGFHTYYGGNAPYFARETGEIADLGVRILGGCCGTTPQYIRALSKVLSEKTAKEIVADTLWTLPVSTDVQKNRSGAQAVSSNRLKKKLSAGKKVIAVELDSPKNADLSTFMEEAGRLKKAGVDTITIADCPIAQARLDASLLACKVKQELDLDVIPHMTCRDRNINASKALLLGDHANGIRNVLIITGDPIPTAARDEVKSVYQFNSRQMIGYVHSLNESDFQDDPFLIFAALNVNAKNYDRELERARKKLQQGAAGFLTQPALSSAAVENLKKTRQAMPEAYILGGLYPVISERNARFMNEEVNGIEVPEEMIAAYHGADREEGEKIGRRFTDELCGRILPFVDGIYLMTPFHRIGLMEKIVGDIREML
ncbi:MAG: bifunctional homocysteine S-methyltransferase/methylenetetrahydrofolate reductase [Lachnospiraceae bacterium]|jgi:homocysteine S-methyltransferase|nr:bifunctional homocysteine S-methyltransferase/methylenetetrahydrofolate reductase [Lachnospiraceae bacterium]MCH4029999.1 bifunctional homocysteine S-methyltransferase/methylenetetrahydrofolate reductase [Lachnospiraceae bacterium]MCH4070341.1 bifunctional homocysteine S-methyltransferase/methylenetetrahydrofolate reductase [Lachnospiraceae bacterium]MCH4107853.1 bifunctional homocysteine S-methyltransferase/methylenetetrahydrofolate reductase [Lachnospiraceae bacterium]MCI1331567.1 bifuncti